MTGEERDGGIVYVMRQGYGFGGLIGLIAATFVWGMSVTGGELATFGFSVLAAATVLDAVWLTGSTRRTVAAWAVVAGVAVASSFAALLGDWDGSNSVPKVMLAALIVVAPAAIIRALVRQPIIDRHTIGGVISLYLLIGLVFATAYSAVEAVTDRAFFVTVADASYSDFLYYSYVTMTTLGYGDLTTTIDFGRALSVLEALVGQVYLVVVVALVIGNVGVTRRRPDST